MPKKKKAPKKEFLKPVDKPAGFEHTLGYGGPKVMQDHACLRCGKQEFDITKYIRDHEAGELRWAVKCRACGKDSVILVTEKEK